MPKQICRSVPHDYAEQADSCAALSSGSFTGMTQFNRLHACLYEAKWAELNCGHCTSNASIVSILLQGNGPCQNLLPGLYLQAWQVAHPPTRGRAWACSRPMVHAGFKRCWQAGGLNAKVLDHVRRLVHHFQHTQLHQDLRIYVTGNAAVFADLPPFHVQSYCRMVTMQVSAHVYTLDFMMFTYVVLFGNSCCSRLDQQ